MSITLEKAGDDGRIKNRFNSNRIERIHLKVNDHFHIRDVGFTLNGEYYPIERSRHDVANNHYTEAHYNNTKLGTSYMNCMQKKRLLDYVSFKTFPIFVKKS